MPGARRCKPPSPAMPTAPRSTGPSSACRCRSGPWFRSACSVPGQCGRPSANAEVCPRDLASLPALTFGSSTMAAPLQAASMRNASQPWSPASWQSRTAVQQPVYADAAALDHAVAQLRELPPLVTSWEVLGLKRKLAEAQEGRCFLLQGGDCAESFADCTSPIISNRLKVLLQMSLVLVHGLKLPVVRVGRFAGQYAKPRSADLEEKNGESLPSYRGDIVNSPEFTPAARRPDP